VNFQRFPFPSIFPVSNETTARIPRSSFYIVVRHENPRKRCQETVARSLENQRQPERASSYGRETCDGRAEVSFPTRTCLVRRRRAQPTSVYTRCTITRIYYITRSYKHTCLRYSVEHVCGVCVCVCVFFPYARFGLGRRLLFGLVYKVSCRLRYLSFCAVCETQKRKNCIVPPARARVTKRCPTVPFDAI